MSVAANDLTDIATTIDHLLPVIISVLAVAVFWLVKTYLPQLHYIDLVSKATNDTGVIELAKYMAKRNGGKHIDTADMWESFIPAAREVSRGYRQKTFQNNLDKYANPE